MPKFLEQDEVSIMSMQSSVTRNMEKLLAEKKAAAQLQGEDGSSRKNESGSRRGETHSNSGDESDSNESSPRGGGSSNVASHVSSHVSSHISSHVSSRVSNRSTKSNDSNREINTGEYDERGYCKHHPTVRLRKKKFMRGWKVVLSNCPECCLDEMRRVKESRRKNREKSRGGSRSGGESRRSKSGSKSGSKSRSNKGSKSSRREKKKKSRSKDTKNPPISQLNLSTAGPSNIATPRDGFDDSRSIGTTSTITISSYTQSTGGTGWQNYTNGGQSVVSGVSGDGRSVVSGGSGSNNDSRSAGSSGKKKDDKPSSSTETSSAHVTRMPYTDAHGEHGWYTGQVDATTGTPHGSGTMNYANGAVYEGEWRDGVSATPSKTREEPGGLGSTSNMLRPPPPPHSRYKSSPSFGGGRSYLATLNEDGSIGEYDIGASDRSLRRSRSASVQRGMVSGASRSTSQPPPQDDLQQQQQRTVVCGMHWTDFDGASGSYTGEVTISNIPDGMGSMRYDHSGFVAEGVWTNGEMREADDDFDDSNEFDDGDVGYNDGGNVDYDDDDGASEDGH